MEVANLHRYDSLVRQVVFVRERNGRMDRVILLGDRAADCFCRDQVTR